MEYRREIDGLRAVAVLPVVLFHAGFKAFEGGFIGVDVFFVISGYLITTIILSDMNKGKFSIVTFYERRARRILPALFFVMLCCLPFAWLWLTPNHLKDFGQSLTAVSAFSSNILFWRESGYFGTASELKPLLHTWSLAVEEQYYVLFPLFLMALWKLRKRWIFASLMVVGAVSLLVAQWGAYNMPSATFYLLPTRGWELAIGALIAFYFLCKREHAEFIKSRKRTSEVFGFIGLFLICYSIFAFDNNTPFPSLYALIPTVGTGLIIIFSTSETVIGRFLGIKPMVGIGLISYSTYLWHQPLFVFARHRSLTEPGTALLLVLSASSILLAYISWRFVESPFRDKKAVSRKGVFAFAVIGSVSFTSVGIAGSFTDGFLNLKVNGFQKKLLATAVSSPKRNDCHTGGVNYLKPQDSCVYKNDNASWATFGDSHTVEIAYALGDRLDTMDMGLRHFSFSGCKPSYGHLEEGSPCEKWTDEAITFISGDKNIKNVVVSYRINAHLAGDQIDFYPGIPELKNEEELKSIIDSYFMILEKLIHSNKNVFLVLQAPELPTDINNLIMKNRDEEKNIKGVSRSWWDKRSEYFMSQLYKFNNNVKIIDPVNYLCDDISCYATKNGISMYFDDDHLSIYGANKVVDMIFDSFEKKNSISNQITTE